MSELVNSKIDFLPLGSVVIVRGGVKKIMVISRGLAVPLEDGTKYFDYGGCLYPEGIVSDKLLYFNHIDIQKVVFNGYSDEDDIMMVENINDWIIKSGCERGNPTEINEKNLNIDNTKREKLPASNNTKEEGSE